MELIPQAPPRAITQPLITASVRGLEESSTETSAHNEKPAYLPRKTDPKGNHVLAGWLPTICFDFLGQKKVSKPGRRSGLPQRHRDKTAAGSAAGARWGGGRITADSSGFVFLIGCHPEIALFPA